MSSPRLAGPARTALAFMVAVALTLGLIRPAFAAPASPEDLAVTITRISDGTAPFNSDDTAGNDSGANNGIVRVNDTVDFRLAYRVRSGTADNVTFSVTLPRGMTLPAVPAFCRAGGVLSPATVTVPVPITGSTIDSLPEQTLTCNVGTQAASTYEVILTATVLNAVHNDQTLQVVSTTITADGVTTPVPTADPLPSVRASSRLQWDLSKNGISTVEDRGAIGNPSFAQCRWDTTRSCLRTTYHIMLSAPTGGKGAMPATGDITLTDDLSPQAMYPQLSAEQLTAINADLDKYGSRIYEGERTHMAPGSKIGRLVSGIRMTATNSVRDSGTMIIDQPGPGQAATITLRNPDLSLQTYPTQVASPVGTTIPTTSAYAVSVAVDVYTPVDTITDFGSRASTNAPWQLPTTNRYTNLSITGLTADDVQTSADQPTWNDYKTSTPEVSIGQSFDKSFGGVPGTEGNMAAALYSPGDSWRAEGPPGGAIRRSGDITVAASQEIVALLNVKGSNPALPAKVSQVMCDSWDNTLLHLKAKDWPASSTVGGQRVPSAGEAVWVSGYTNVLNAAGTNAVNATDPSQTPTLTVQYSPTPGERAAQSTCGENNGPWYDNPEDVPGNDPAKAAEGVYTAVARVRIHMVVPEPVGPFLVLGNGITTQVAIGFEVADSGMPAGTVIPNWASIKREDFKDISMEELLASTASSWLSSYYNPTTHAGGAMGDRLLLTEVQARVDKTVRKGESGTFGKTPPSTTGGDIVQYQLATSLTSPAAPIGLKRDMWIEDCLPDSQNYVSAVPQPAVISSTTPSDAKRAACGTGYTYLRWVYDDWEVGTQIDPIILTVEVSPMAANGTYNNTVVAWGENDASALALRSSNAQIQISNIAGLMLQKVALTPIVQVNREGQTTDQINRWRIQGKNTLPATDTRVVQNPTIIDVVPTNGVSGSHFTGRFVFVEATPPASDPNLVFQYTSNANVNVDPQDASNGASGSTAWCDAPAGGNVVTGSGTCPAATEEVTAVRVIRPGLFASGASIEFDIALKGIGDTEGDVFVNRAALAAEGFTFSVGPVNRAETVVSSTVGDRFWIDTNGNGIQDAGESGVSGARVTLTGTDDLGNAVSAETTTDSEGNYTFPGLRASDATGYRVTFEIPAALQAEGYEFTATEAGTDRAVDSNANALGVAPPVVVGHNTDELTVDAGIALPRIALEKTADLESVKPGDVVTYTFTATNTGGATLSGATLSETSFTNAFGEAIHLDAAPTFREDLSTGTLTEMKAGQTLVWTATYTVRRADLTVDGSLDNAASVSATSLRGQSVSATADATVPSSATATFVMAKTADPVSASSVVVGDTITYTVTVRHRGELALTGASVSDDLSAILDDADYNNDAVASSGAVSVTGGTLSWSGDLEVGQVVTITYSVTVKRGGDLTLRNAVTTTDGRGSCEATDACTVTHAIPAVPGVDLVKTADHTEVNAGDVITYTFTATNTGNVPLTGITLDDTSFVNARGQTITLDAPPTIDTNASTGTPALLGVDQVLVWTATYTVQAADLDEGASLVNTATVTGTPPAGDPVTDEATANVGSAGRGTFTMAKTADPSGSTSLQVGDTITYTITIRQTDQLRALGASVSDDLSAILDDADYNNDAVASSGAVSVTGGTLSWSGDLEVGQVVTITYSVTVKRGGDLTLRNAVTTTDGRGSCEATDACTVTHAIPAVPGVDLVKTADHTEVNAGDVITYTFTATNTGNVPLTGITLDDTSFVNARGQTITLDAPPTIDTNASTGTPALLGVDQVLVWTATYTVQAADLDEGASLVNTATVTGTPPAGDPVTDEATANVGSAGRGTFTMAKTADPSGSTSLQVGDTITYTITIRQTDQLRVVGATVTDDLTRILDDAVYNADVSATSGTAVVSGSTLTWSGDIEVGQTVTITYSVTLRRGGDLTLRNAVTTTDNRGSCATPSGCETMNGIPENPAISLTKTTNTATVSAGDVITYTFTATNTGNVPLTGITLDDTSFVNARGQTITLDAPPTIDTNASTGTPALLGVDQVLVWTATYTVQAADLDEGASLVNTATVTGESPRGTEVSDDDEASVVSFGRGTYVFAKASDSADTAAVEVGDRITYTITITHTGELRVVGATVTDDLTRILDDADYNNDLTASSGTATVEGHTLTWRGDIQVGQVITLTYSVTVKRGGDLSLVNAVATNDARGACANPDACETVNAIPPAPAIELAKSADKTLAVPGDVITYTFTATNTGNVPLTGITLDDTSFVNARGQTITLDAPPAVLDAATTGSLDRLGVDEVIVWTAAYTVTADDLAEDRSLVNVATVTGTPPAGDPVSDADDANVASGRGSFVIVKTSDPATAATVKVGDKVTYTVRITQTGHLAVTGATITDDLTRVLDDATLTGDLTASAGTARLSGRTLTWGGDIEVGQTVTLTYSVTVAGGGDSALHNTVTTTDERGACLRAGGCVTDHSVTPATPGGSDLARTGSEPMIVFLLVVAGACLAGGLVLLLRNRRRHDT